MIRYIIGILSILALLDCSSVQSGKYNTFEIQNKIIENLSFLKECKAEGLANINYNGFEIKTNFLLRKKDSKVRIDIFSGGILGLSPAPKAQIVLRDNFVNVFIPDQKRLTITRLIPADSLVNVQGIVGNYGVVENFGYYKTSPFNGVYYIFDKKFHLKVIQIREIRIQLTKYKRNLPYQITVLKDKNEILTLEIDKWDFPHCSDNIFDFEVPTNVQIEANELDLIIPIEIIEEE
ncbi:hypothetical protein D4R71_00200 [bacterium]|nr:MAG: hypothetical protein D4R71_00200 [bacterium]